MQLITGTNLIFCLKSAKGRFIKTFSVYHKKQKQSGLINEIGKNRSKIFYLSV
jgi:hypothetical protein